MSAFNDFLQRVIFALQKSDLSYVVVGGVAAIIRGRIRTTTDLDLIIENDTKKFRIFLNLLKKTNFDILETQVTYFLKEKFNLSIFDNNSLMRIDLKFAQTNDDHEAMNNSADVEYSGMNFKITSVNQILYGKLIYLGDISNLSDSELLGYNDVLDFIAVFSQNQELVDLSWLKQKANIKNLSNSLERLLFLSHQFI